MYQINEEQLRSVLASRLQHIDNGDTFAAKQLDWAVEMQLPTFTEEELEARHAKWCEWWQSMEKRVADTKEGVWL